MEEDRTFRAKCGRPWRWCAGSAENNERMIKRGIENYVERTLWNTRWTVCP